MKKLTVAISCYNFEDYLEKCLDSILIQKTNFDFDIIIRDDCSNDNSRTVIENISSKYSGVRNIRYIFGDTNCGVNKNVQLLLSECKSEYISLLDGDDLLTDDTKLQRQVEFLENNPEYAIHSTSYRYLYNDGTISPEEGWLCAVKEVISLQDLLDQNFITFGRTFRNIQNLFKDLGEKEWYLNIPYDDWALNFEILKHGLAKCDMSWCTGLYRITGRGVLTKDSEETLNSKNELCRSVLREEYTRFTNSDSNN